MDDFVREATGMGAVVEKVVDTRELDREREVGVGRCILEVRLDAGEGIN